jgi:hypothetical protein
MAPWTFSLKFPYDTQFIFEPLMFTAGEDESLELLTRGPAPRYPAPVYETTPYYPVDPSTSSRAYLDLNPHAMPYYLSTMTSQGHLIGRNHPPVFGWSIELLVFRSNS